MQPAAVAEDQVTGSVEFGRGNDRDRDRASDEEEEESEQPLIRNRAKREPPGSRVHVLVDLADPDAPDQARDDDGHRRSERVRRGRAEGSFDQGGRGPCQLEVSDQVLREEVSVALQRVEVCYGHERRQQDGERRVHGYSAARVRLPEIAAEPLQREPT